MENIKLTNLLNNNGQIEGLPKNPRLIKDERFEKLKKSIQDDPEMLQLRELLVYPYNDKFIVIGGNMRLKAMKELGYKEAPCKVIDASTPPEKLRAYTIKDNVGYGEHDIDLLANDWDVEELKDWGVEDIDFEIEDIEPEETEGDDDIPESAPAITVKGDLYELGEHRLLCGDSTLIDDVDKLMGGEKANMVFTDPPYNISFNGSMGNTTKDGKNISMADGYTPQNSVHNDIRNDKMSEDEFKEFMDSIIKNITIFCKGAWYIAFGSQTIDQLLKPLKDFNMSWKSIIIWMKNQASMSGKDYKSRYEFIVYGDFGSNFEGERYNEEDIWEIQRTLKNDLHPTMKPIALCAKAISNSSKKDGLILDLFLGSGSTLIACEKTNRKCYGLELDEKYCDVIVKRYIDFCQKNDRPVSVKRNGEDCLKDFESNIE